MMKNKKGQFEYIVIIVFVVIFVVAGGVIWYTMDTVLNEVKADPDLAPYATDTIDKAQDQYDTLLNVGITAILIGMFLSMIISFAFVGSHPIVIIIHLIVLGVAVMMGAELSNLYVDNIANVPEFASYFQEKLVYPTIILTELPIYLTVFGFISMVVLVSKYLYDKRSGGVGGVYVSN